MVPPQRDAMRSSVERSAAGQQTGHYTIGVRLIVGEAVDVRGDIVAQPAPVPSRDELLRALMTRRVG